MSRFQISTFMRSLSLQTKSSNLENQQSFSNPIQQKQKRKRGKKPVTVTVTKPPTVDIQPKVTAKKKRKQKIPVALREQVWIHRMGRVFEGKCPTTWCENTITVFDFQSGHNIPESKGGPTNLENLIPLCSRCNLSMGDSYNFEEWCNISNEGNTKKTVEVVEPPKRSCLFPWIRHGS